MKTTINADQLEELLYGIEKLISEGLLRFSEDGLFFEAADPAMVSMVDLEIPADSFEEYEIDTESELYEEYTSDRTDEEGMLVGVNIENLHSVVKMFDEEITIKVEDSDIVLTEGQNKFTLPVLNLSVDDIPSTDQLDHLATGEITVDQLKELVDKAGVASDSADFSLDVEDGQLEVEADGDQVSVETAFDLQNVEAVNPEDEDEEPADSADSMFSLDYLKKFERLFNKMDSCDDFTIEMGDDFPMELHHESSRENLTLVLAPRIEEN